MTGPLPRAAGLLSADGAGVEGVGGVLLVAEVGVVLLVLGVGVAATSDC